MQATKADYPYIVADIGGTNARFGLVTDSGRTPGRLEIVEQHTFPSNEFENLEQATRHYMSQLSEVSVKGACLAVAGPVGGDTVRLTNLNWAFSINDVKRALGITKLKVINDFAAYAFATPHVAHENLLSLNEGQAFSDCPIAIVGPGTGFGVASLVPTGECREGDENQKFTVVSCEGGHITLAAKTPMQMAVINVLGHEFSHLSVEHVLSGPGLRNLYRALAKVEGKTVEPLRASEITGQALKDPTSLEYRTLRLFCAWLGQVCGDIALTLGARGGVFLGGGVLLRFTEFLQNSRFMDNFSAKGQLQEYMRQMPVKLVTEGNSALLGAAAWFER